MRAGSLFAGYGGLDLAVNAYFGATTAWFSEADPAPSRILAHHWPDVPNHGDITRIDWTAVEPIDILCGGFPCQDVSAAGRRAGIRDGTRSGLWSYFAEAINETRPKYVVIENVRGLLSAEAHRVESDPDAVGDGSSRPILRALGAVLGDLSDIGYDAQWTTVAAASVGACHRRERVFILATPADAERGGCGGDARASRRGPGRRATATGGCEGGNRGDAVGGVVGGAARSGEGAGGEWQWDGDAATDRGAAVADATRDGRHEGWAEPAGIVGGHDVAERSASSDGLALLPTPQARDHKGAGNPPGRTRGGRLRTQGDDTLPDAVGIRLLPTPRTSDTNGAGSHGDGGPDLRTAVIDWGQYDAAVRRAELALGRSAPAPTELNRSGKPRLSAAFAEWMMMLPAGHVTDPVIGLSRNEQLKAVGNGVVPPQAFAALTMLVPISLGVA